MPTIQRPAPKPKKERKQTDMRKLRQEAYQNTTWRKLRNTYLKSHPVCEECLKTGKVTPATDIHHIKSPFRNGEVNYGLLLDDTNLMSLCAECHGKIHAAQQGHISPEEVLRQLEELFDENKPDEYFD